MPKSSLRTARHRALIRVLVDARKAQGMTQRQLAAKLRTTQNYIAQIEAGLRRVDVVEFTELAVAIGIDPLDLYKRVLAR